jgi:membrane associated rhomboid family serine protease
MRDLERALRRSGRPATAIVVALIGVVYVLAWFTKSPFFVELAFNGLARPWTALTYPLASTGSGGAFIGVLLELWWLWMIGGEVESVMGTARYAVFFALATLVGALGISVGTLLVSHGALLFGPLLPIGAVTVAWATRSPNASVRIYGVIPITARWLAVIYAGIVLFSLGESAPLMGVFGLLPLALGFFLASGRIPGVPYSAAAAARESRAERRKREEFDNEVRDRKKDREERERLRKLFEGSLDDK